MADIENWLISWTSCATNTKDPKKIKRQKVQTILENVSGNFQIHRVPRAFLARSFEAPTNPFQRSYRCTWKKNHILFVRKGYEMILLSFCYTSIRQIGLGWIWLKTCVELIQQRHELWQFWRFCSRKYCKPFQVNFSQTSQNFNKETSLPYVWD